MGEERIDKICIHCKWFVPETDSMTGECEVDEDINSEEWCELYEKEGR